MNFIWTEQLHLDNSCLLKFLLLLLFNPVTIPSILEDFISFKMHMQKCLHNGATMIQKCAGETVNFL